MPQIQRWMVATRLGIALLGASAMVMTGSGMAHATYGPPPPPVTVPGGFLTVVTSQNCGPAGVTIGPVNGGNTTTTVTVPPGTCRTPLQITITEPDVSAIGNAGFCGYQAVAGIGVIIQNPDGSVNDSFFLHPIVVTIKSPEIKPGNIIVAWNGREFVRVGVATSDGSATIKLDRAGYNFFAVLAPTGTSALDPCSTSNRLGTGGPGAGFGAGGFGPGSFGQPGAGQAFV